MEDVDYDSYKNKGDIQDCTNYKSCKLKIHTAKLWEIQIDFILSVIQRAWRTRLILS